MLMPLTDVPPSEIVFPALPETTSAAMRAAVERYRAGFLEPSDSGNAWVAAADALFALKPNSHADLSAKLLVLTHYLQPSVRNGTLTIDLNAFDGDAGRKLLRIADDAVALGDAS